MSEIITDKLTGKTSAGDVTITSEGGSATMQLQQGLTKAWINFQGNATGAVSGYARDSLNLSVTIDNAAGDYTLGFTNNMGNSNYSNAGSAGGINATSNGAIYAYEQLTAKTTSVFRIAILNSNGGLVDTLNVEVHVMGDLA